MSEKRRGLGRGLGALIPDSPAGAVPGTQRPVDVWFRDQDKPTDGSGDQALEPASGSGPNQPVDQAQSADTSLAPVPGAFYREIDVAAIRPNPRQPREIFDEEALAELVHSIREIGVLQPIVVRPVPDEGEIQFELIMGERRWRASREAERDSIPAIVRTTEDEDLLRDALLENLHRSNLNVLEEASAYQQLLDDFGCSQEELARRIGRSRPQISNTLRLLRLPPVVARRVAAGVLSAGHARALLTLDDPAEMERLAQRIVAEGLSVRSVEEIVALGVAPQPPVSSRTPGRSADVHPHVDGLAARLSDQLDTRVKIALGQRKGKLTIEFASVDDLHRVVSQMGIDTSEE